MRHECSPYETSDTLYVVTVVFNPRGFKSRIKLYKDFEPYVAYSGAKLLTVEIAFGNRPFECTKPDNPWNVQLRTTAELWHKERGLNIGIHRLLQLVPDAKYIAWVDADIKFSNPYWVEDTIRGLHHHKVVQMFSEAQSLNPDYESQWKTPGLFYNYVNKIGYHQHPPKPLKYTTGGHPGLAWAARREVLDQLGGLLDFCIHGSGDTHMANALMGDVTHYMRPGASVGFMKALKVWESRCEKFVKKDIGYIKGIVLHYWHGKPQQRGYEKRWDIICFHKFDPYHDIYLDMNSLYQFSGEKPHLEDDLRRSLISRNEDSIDV